MARTKARESYGSGSINEVLVSKTDSKGKVVRDKDGTPIKVQKKDKDGKPAWRITITLGQKTYFDKNGKARKRQMKVSRTYYGTLTDARAYKKALMDEYKKLDKAAIGDTFADAVEKWSDKMELDGTCAPSKLRDYKSRLGYVSPYLSNKPLLEVSAEDVTAAIAAAQKRRKLSQRTKREVFLLVKRVLRFSKQRRYVAENVLEDETAPKAPKTVERNFLTFEECADFMRKLDDNERLAYADYREKESRQADNGNTFGRTRLYGLNTLGYLMAVRLMCATGMRRGEVLGLMWDFVDFDRGEVKVAHAFNSDSILKQPKTKAGRRTISIDAVTVEHLREWKSFQKKALHLLTVVDDEGNVRTIGQDGNTPVCCSSEGGFIEPHALSHWWDKYRKEVNYPRLRMHELRHTQASLLIGSGKDIKTVQLRLGHEKSTTTLDYYGHLLPKNDKDAADFMGAVLYGQTTKKHSDDDVLSLEKSA